MRLNSSQSIFIMQYCPPVVTCFNNTSVFGIIVPLGTTSTRCYVTMTPIPLILPAKFFLPVQTRRLLLLPGRPVGGARPRRLCREEHEPARDSPQHQHRRHQHQSAQPLPVLSSIPELLTGPIPPTEAGGARETARRSTAADSPAHFSSWL